MTTHRTTCWPTSQLMGYPHQSAMTLAAYLADSPIRATHRPDACLATHDRVRCRSVHGVTVHRLDSARGLKFYTTGCGLRVAKVAGTLVAAEVDCRHHGCKAAGS